ncbi:MAG: hypothetical protein K2X35_22005 [Bryobacteraceae bacterium]|nr:hypothetical protein [Bryobacteraceae bacterium]
MPELYRTESLLTRELEVVYPVQEGKVVLRTELDWESDLEPCRVSPDGTVFTFRLEARKPFLYFKPCLVSRTGSRWATGPNGLVLMTTKGTRQVFPQFDSSAAGTFTPVLEVDSAILGRKQMVRVYLPAGYHENTLRRYPVMYMQDGKNLFFPEEAFLGREWKVDEALHILDLMSAGDRCVVVGIYSHDRMQDYTKPGYEAFASSVVEEIIPQVNQQARVFTTANETGVMGSSLGGVVSFYMAWQYPEIFGFAACLSSTFSHRDDLIDRVLTEPRRDVRFYLDSGWPGDNYEVTLAMALALSQRGYTYGEHFLHFSFPLEEHDEDAWGRRLHLPLQLFSGKLSTAARGRFV